MSTANTARRADKVDNDHVHAGRHGRPKPSPAASAFETWTPTGPAFGFDFSGIALSAPSDTIRRATRSNDPSEPVDIKLGQQETVSRKLKSGSPNAAPAALRRATRTNDPAEPVDSVEEPQREQELPVARKIRVGASDDPAESEADAMADKVLRMTLPEPVASEPASSTDALLRKQGSGADAGESMDAEASRAVAGADSGRPLSEASRTFFEPRFDRNLESVRLHEGSRAAGSAEALNARAFAHRDHIWLGAGERESDRRLLAHELAHVVQWGASAGRPIRRYTRKNTIYLYDIYVSKGSVPDNVSDSELMTSIEYEDYIRPDLQWNFSEAVALAAARRSMDLFVSGVRGRRPNHIRSATEAGNASHGLTDIAVTSLGFSGDHMITAVAGGLGSATGAAIDDPDGSTAVWTTGGSAPTVAYTLGDKPSLFASFVVNPAISPAVPDVRVRAQVGTQQLGEATGLTMEANLIESTAGSNRVDGITGNSVPGGPGLGLQPQTINFAVSNDGGTIWFNAGEVAVNFVFTAATPSPPGGILREDVILKGGAKIAAAASAEAGLREMVQTGVSYNPSIVLGAGFDTTDAVMTAFTTPHQCDSMAFLMRYLAKSFGIAADVEYFWMGTSTEQWRFPIPSTCLVGSSWFGPLFCLGHASFQCNRPAEDSAPTSPHFNFHAFTVIGGVKHDPSYNMTGLPTILENSTGASNQFGPRSTFTGLPNREVDGNCSH